MKKVSIHMTTTKPPTRKHRANEPKVHQENTPTVKIKSLKKAPAIPPAYSSDMLQEEEAETARSEQGFFEAFSKFAELCGLDESLLSGNDDLPLGYEIVLPDSEYRAAIAMENDGEERLDGLMFLAVLSGQEIEEPIDAAAIRRVLLDSSLTDAAMRLIGEANGLK